MAAHHFGEQAQPLPFRTCGSQVRGLAVQMRTEAAYAERCAGLRYV